MRHQCRCPLWVIRRHGGRPRHVRFTPKSDIDQNRTDGLTLAAKHDAAVQMIDTSITPRPYSAPATSRRTNRMAAAAFLRSEIASAEYQPCFQLAFRLRASP